MGTAQRAEKPEVVSELGLQMLQTGSGNNPSHTVTYHIDNNPFLVLLIEVTHILLDFDGQFLPHLSYVSFSAILVSS